MAEYFEDWNSMPEEERKRRRCYSQAQLDSQNAFARSGKANPFGQNGKTHEEIIAQCSIAGKKANENRRKRKTFKEMMEKLLDEPAIDKDGNEMDVTWADLITERAIQRATGYGMPANQAFEQLLAIVDEKPVPVTKEIIEALPTITLQGFDDK